MMRLTKLVPAAENPPVVIPAPKINALAAVVVTVPLFAEVPVPDAEVPTLNGLTGSRPLYSRARMSTYGVDALKITVTVFVPAAAAFMFAGVIDGLTKAAAPRGWDGLLIHVAGRVSDRGDI